MGDSEWAILGPWEGSFTLPPTWFRVGALAFGFRVYPNTRSPVIPAEAGIQVDYRQE